MTRWCYQEPGDDGAVVTVTEAEILAQYFAYWQGEMTRVGKAGQISERACIEDFVVVHWAWAADDDGT